MSEEITFNNFHQLCVKYDFPNVPTSRHLVV